MFKILFFIIVFFSTEVFSGQYDCSNLSTYEKRQACKGNCDYIDKYEIRQACTGDCDYINEYDLRQACKGNCDYIDKYEARTACKSCKGGSAWVTMYKLGVTRECQ